MSFKIIKFKNCKLHRSLVRKFSKELYDICSNEYGFKTKVGSNVFRYEKDKQAYFILKDGEFIGMFSLKKPDNEYKVYKYLWRFIITKKHRNKGYGESIMRMVIDNMIPKGMYIILCVDVPNTRSKGFYENKFGFRIWNTENNSHVLGLKK